MYRHVYVHSTHVVSATNIASEIASHEYTDSFVSEI